MSNSLPQLRIVVDNHASDGLVAEHGLSILIEAGGSRILFDAGQGDALEHNARELDIMLSHVDMFVLSHGHYDHTGAIDYVMQESPELQVYAHPDIFKIRYSIHPGRSVKEISMPSEERLIIGNLPDSHLHWVREPVQIAAGVWLTGPIPREHPQEDTGGPFFEDTDGRVPDPITDDLALWIETPDGPLVNTLDYIQSIRGEKRIRGIVGGFHLKNASRDRLETSVAALRELKPDFMVPCHCTGDDAIDFFKANLNIDIQPGFAGFKL